MSEGVAVDEAAKAKLGESHFAILLFLALALMSALLNSSAPTPLYPLYQHELALSSVSLTVIYGAYAAGVLISLFGVGNMAGKVKDLRKWIAYYDEAERLVEEVALSLEYYKEEITTEEEVDEAYSRAILLFEEVEL